jgi:pimeloyl-ACP methyl ester carboxylesterase
LRQRAEAYQEQDVEALLRLQNEFVYSEPGTEEVKRLVLEHQLSLPRNTILSFYDAGPEADISPLLSRIPCPVLVVHGTDDRLISFATAEYLKCEIPNTQLCAFKGKGHVPIFTATLEFCEIPGNFVVRRT